MERRTVPDITKENLMPVLRKVAKAYTDFWEKRVIIVMHADSYEDPEYRVWFFYVAGSPAKSWGSISQLEHGFRMRIETVHDKLQTVYLTAELQPCSKRAALFGPWTMKQSKRWRST